MELGVGEEHPVVSLVKIKLGVYPANNVYTPDLAARIRGWRRRRSEDPWDVIIDARMLQDLEI